MKRLTIGLSIVLGMMFSLNILANKPLSFEERVKAQEAIERVYYSHRIWPKENPQPKPPFEKMVTKEQIEAKVTDYLKKSAALDQFWQRPIEGKQLQAEMDRMAKGTKDPKTLNELFKALNDDPYLIAECLARPVLADRLIRNWYANDERFHKETREKAEEALKTLTTENFCENTEGQYSKMTYKLERPGQEENERLNPEDHEIKLDEKEFASLLTKYQASDDLAYEERPEAIYLVKGKVQSRNTIEIEELRFSKCQFDGWWTEESIQEQALTPEIKGINFVLPSAKLSGQPCLTEWVDSDLNQVLDGKKAHASVWTGTEMIVWGGVEQEGWALSSTGGRYNPSTDTWSIMSTGENCPDARSVCTSIWTGSEMIIWGGEDWNSSYSYVNSGGRYNPQNDAWLPTSTGVNCPTPRGYQTAIWTGSQMIVWGGKFYDSSWHYFNTGGKYDPSTNTWVPMSTGLNCPLPRGSHSAIWTGSEMIIWGGEYYNTTTSYFNTGGKYDPSTDTWLSTSFGVNVPAGRVGNSALWIGSDMIIWGGYNGTYLNSGGKYNPIADSWTTTSISANCPSPRTNHTAVWTGSEMITWGGKSSATVYLNTGGKYNPSTDIWLSTDCGTSCPNARIGHSAIWTGSEMIIWGGEAKEGSIRWFTNTGSKYNPTSDSWITTTLPLPYISWPAGRMVHTAVWSGSEMIIWGGDSKFEIFDSGDRYTPATDSWTPTSTGTNCPVARSSHTAIWSGSEMVVWGGYSGGLLNTGGKYNPVSNSWVQTSTSTNCPSARMYHKAVWSGSEMIVWGGQTLSEYLNSGGRYNPSNNSWQTTSTGAYCPSARVLHTAVWAGSEMIIWGGYGGSNVNTGGRYNPTEDTWNGTSTDANVPSSRSNHTAIWTGSKMIIWGGNYRNTGGQYDPLVNSWTAISTGTNCPIGREKHIAVWTGNEMIVFGGNNSQSNFSLKNAGRYNPDSDSWDLVNLPKYLPPARMNHTAVWTGDSMILWGGYSDLASGAIYALPPKVSGDDSPCAETSVLLSTSSFLAYQWYLNDTLILGATAQNYLATQTGGYSAEVTRRDGCTQRSDIIHLTFVSIPLISGNNNNDCPSSNVLLSTEEGNTDYQWLLNGSPISGANSNAYTATTSGSYTVSVTDSNGCSGTSDAHVVTIAPCIPNILYSSHGTFTQVTGDGDAYFEKGELWSVPITVTNSGNTPATNVTASLSGNGITVCNSPGSFGTIVAGGTASFTFEFLISNTFSPCSGAVNFNLGSKACVELIPAGSDESNLFSIQVGEVSAGVPTDLVLQPSTADSYVYQLATTTNYGTATLMYAQARTGQARRSLVQFDISSIPSGSTINSATLELYATAVSGSQTLNVHRITGTWTETGVTWTNQPAFTSTADASITGGTGAGWRVWNVLPVVQSWANGTNTNYGFIVKCNLETGLTAITYTFATKEYATTSLRPILRINYTPATSWNCDYVGTGVCSVPLPGEAAPGDTYENGQMWSEDKNTQSWPALSGATGYKLYRGVQSGLASLLNSDHDSCLRYNSTNTSINISSDDPSLETGSFYWYLVVGTNGEGDGPAGNARIVNSTGNCP